MLVIYSKLMERKRSALLWRSLKKTITLVIGAFLLVVAFAVTAHANGAEILVKNNNNYDVNSLKFKRIEYVGQCPGVVISPSTLEAKFSSTSTLPAPNRKVIIRNLTKGFNSNPYPYTDRGYSEGRYSQDFEFKLGDSHKTKSFSVLEGENQLDYEIKEADRSLEKGALKVQVSIENAGTFSRDIICQEELSCNEESAYDCSDRDRGSRRRFRRKICVPTRRCYCPS